MTLEEFGAVDLRVGKIVAAERVANSLKLVKLEVDLGEERRQIIAGIGKMYAPEDLKEKQIVVVANLEPRKLMDLESQGMLLAAHNVDGDPVILTVEKDVPPGSKIT